jgi:hypothetical protein
MGRTDSDEQVATSDTVAYLKTQVQLLTDDVKWMRLTDEETKIIKEVIRREVSANWGTPRNLAGPLQSILNRIGGTQ